MPQLTFAEFCANLTEHFDRLEADRTELIVTRQNHEPVALIPLAELEGLRETLHLLGTPANAEHLRRSIEQLEAGKGSARDPAVLMVKDVFPR